MRKIALLVRLVGLSFLAYACGGEPEGARSGAGGTAPGATGGGGAGSGGLGGAVSGGAPTTGGTAGLGGSSGGLTGGTAGLGGASASGATAGTGGAPSGGGPSTGGVPTGGTAGAGGAPSGGTPGTGGAPTGGTPGTGGMLATGGGPTGGTSGDGGASTGGAPGTGGAATGGEPGTGGTLPVDEPELVTSGLNDYWQEGELTELATATADISVSPSTRHQQWDGFGGTFNEVGWEVLLLLDAGERERAIRMLFDAVEGARLAYGRIPIGASDYALSRYTLCEQADDFSMSTFSIARDHDHLIPYIQAALAVKPELHLWASPWSPPAWMKDNNSIDGGNMRSEPQILEAHALYLARFVEEYEAAGLDIEMVMPQNEPGYETRYPSCLWTPTLLRDYLRDYLAPTFAERSVPAEIWLGTMSAPEDAEHVQTAMADSTLSGSVIKGIGLQWNLVGSVGSWASQYRLPIMQTEHKCGNYPWETATFNPTSPPNDHAYAEESWGLIAEWIKAGVNTYSAWNMVLDTQGQNLDVERPWPQNALLTVDRGSRVLTATPAYYVFRHLSQYVDPGATRIGTTGSFTDALAFENPDGSVVTILHNSGGSPRQTTLGLGTTTVQFSIPARGWATVNWQGA